MTDKTRRSRRFTLPFVLAIVAAVAAIGVTALLVNIFQRQQESQNPFYRVVDLSDEVTDPAEWGKNFPLQYDGYRRTVDQIRTRYGGSEATPRTPSQADPRSVVAQSRIEEDPRLKRMWAGYAFATDFREERGHAYMLDDQTFTERQTVAKQPGTCMHCHASVYGPYRRLGGGDLIKGFELMNQMPYPEARKLVTHPVACVDCHDPQSMQLRVTRPGFLEGITLVKAAQSVKDYDVNRDATRQEMRAFVCGQCHVEYYFRGTEERLTYPWAKGLKADEILAYYEENGFQDWTHGETEAPMALLDDITGARARGASAADMRAAQQMQRRGQFLLDFIEAENSMGFHAGGEAARVLAKSIDYLRQGQIAVRDAAVSTQRNR